MNKKIKLTYNAPVVLIFSGVCLAATILNYITGGFSNQLLFMEWHSSLLSPMTYVRFFTHVFGHADWAHLLGNMSYILLLGPMLEEKYSSSKVVKVIVITALISGLFNYIVFPNTGLCGASSVCFAFILLASFAGFKEGEIPLTFILVAIIFLGQQIYDGIFLQDNISNISHILGGIVGSIAGFSFNKKQRRTGYMK